MNIIATQYTLKTKSLEIYIAGCSGNPHCKDCHNPLTWDFTIGDLYNEEYFSRIKEKNRKFDLLIDNIMIFGGEPLDQPMGELKVLLKDLKTLNKPVWLFTRYNLVDIPNDIKEYLDYIKCGRYIPELSTDDNIMYGIQLATSNQKIYKRGVDY